MSALVGVSCRGHGCGPRPWMWCVLVPFVVPFGASLGPFEPIFLTTQMWTSDFAFKADKLCRGQMHYKFCPSPRADALQVLSLSEGRCITSFVSL